MEPLSIACLREGRVESGQASAEQQGRLRREDSPPEQCRARKCGACQQRMSKAWYQKKYASISFYTEDMLKHCVWSIRLKKYIVEIICTSFYLFFFIGAT